MHSCTGWHWTGTGPDAGPGEGSDVSSPPQDGSGAGPGPNENPGSAGNMITNLETIVNRLKKTQAMVILSTTTIIPNIPLHPVLATIITGRGKGNP
jgi:hypothetical protein